MVNSMEIIPASTYGEKGKTSARRTLPSGTKLFLISDNRPKGLSHLSNRFRQEITLYLRFLDQSSIPNNLEKEEKVRLEKYLLLLVGRHE